MKAKHIVCRTSVAAVASMAFLAGCSEPKEKVKPEPAGLAAASSTETPPTETPSGEWVCPPKTLGAKMVLIPVDEGKPYCIDEREGTYGEYKEFLSAKGGDFSGQPPECDWNDDYGPASSVIPEWSADRIPQYYGPTMEEADPDRALQGLDFCDAWAFCAWAGKRLCSVRGAEPGKVTTVDYRVVNPADGTISVGDPVLSVKSEWYNVCTEGGTTKYPYGDELKPGTCIAPVKIEAEGESARNVKDLSRSECHGTQPPYDQAYNMSGSNWVWINICLQEAWCPNMGGQHDGLFDESRDGEIVLRVS